MLRQSEPRSKVPSNQEPPPLALNACEGWGPPTETSPEPYRQYPVGMARLLMNAPLRGDSFHTWNPVTK